MNSCNVVTNSRYHDIGSKTAIAQHSRRQPGCTCTTYLLTQVPVKLSLSVSVLDVACEHISVHCRFQVAIDHYALCTYVCGRRQKHPRHNNIGNSLN